MSNLQRLLEKQREAETNSMTGMPLTKEVGVGTPVHFTETHVIDLNYHWNEWELRRRALKLVNLKSCTTHGTQTDASHFRREMDTQVYLPRESDTQTTRSRGTNPPIVTTYVTGLRGQVLQPVAEAKSSSSASTPTASAKAQDKKSVGAKDAPQGKETDFAPRKLAHPKVSVVKLTLDL